MLTSVAAVWESRSSDMELSFPISSLQRHQIHRDTMRTSEINATHDGKTTAREVTRHPSISSHEETVFMDYFSGNLVWEYLIHDPLYAYFITLPSAKLLL